VCEATVQSCRNKKDMVLTVCMGEREDVGMVRLLCLDMSDGWRHPMSHGFEQRAIFDEERDPAHVLSRRASKTAYYFPWERTARPLRQEWEATWGRLS
jgi:hypothetical protein